MIRGVVVSRHPHACQPLASREDGLFDKYFYWVLKQVEVGDWKVPSSDPVFSSNFIIDGNCFLEMDCGAIVMQESISMLP